MAYVAGVIVGLAVGIGILALLFHKKVLDMTFDERQELARGKAFRNAFFALVIMVGLFGVLDLSGVHLCDVMTGCMICICVSLMVFAITCIINDAYLSLKEQPKKVMTCFVVITAVNLLLGTVNLSSGEMIKNGMLTFRSINLICGITTLVILVVYLVNVLLDEQEAE